MTTLLTTTNIPGFAKRSGKVRDIYDLGHCLAIVCTDRISAFDWILPGGIPNKGRVLHYLSRFWFTFLSNIPNHFLTDDARELMNALCQEELDPHLIGRTMLVQRCHIIPVECIVRGYLSGSGWTEYQRTQTVCSLPLPTGLTESAQLPEPIFTPSTKADQGKHDANISFEQMCDIVGQWLGKQAAGRRLATEMKNLSISAYTQAAQHALERGIIIADTKFEWGYRDQRLVLADEVLTPDSSRFWPADQYQPGCGQPSFDKQCVRDWLTDEAKWDRSSPPPSLPDHVVSQTAAKYTQAYEIITGNIFPW